MAGSSFVNASGHFRRLAEMAPNQNAVELQTREIIKHLLEDELVAGYDQCQFSHVETDSPAGNDGKFGFLLHTLSSGCVSVCCQFLLNAHFKGALLYISALYFSSSMTHMERDKLFDLHGSDFV